MEVLVDAEYFYLYRVVLLDHYLQDSPLDPVTRSEES